MSSSNPATTSLKKSSSCSNVPHIQSHSSAQDASTDNSSLFNVLQQTTLVKIKELLPELINKAVQQELKPALQKRDELKLEMKNLRNKVEGYKTQVDTWVKLAKNMEEKIIPKLTEDVNTLESNWKTKEKSIVNKTKEFVSTKNKLQKEMAEIARLQKEWETLLKAKTDGCMIESIEKYQKFVSDEYDDVRAQQKKIATTITTIEEKLAKQARKSEHNANPKLTQKERHALSCPAGPSKPSLR